ncbi:hypothetical protein Anapl_07361 [Anas platyrhynchos]|uniref:Uncharacterized protein n=1 Tax=Anas platyrhynchos TaxID=8839 RepID=R0LEA8_ANAPL|nr:hypothetical protein Anapl_07361 [Anas platyrhynchos]
MRTANWPFAFEAKKQQKDQDRLEPLQDDCCNASVQKIGIKTILGKDKIRRHDARKDLPSQTEIDAKEFWVSTRTILLQTGSTILLVLHMEILALKVCMHMNKNNDKETLVGTESIERLKQRILILMINGSNSATSSQCCKDTGDHGHGVHGKDALIHSDQHAGTPSTSSAPAEQLVEIKAAPDLHSKLDKMFPDTICGQAGLQNCVDAPLHNCLAREDEEITTLEQGYELTRTWVAGYMDVIGHLFNSEALFSCTSHFNTYYCTAEFPNNEDDWQLRHWVSPRVVNSFQLREQAQLQYIELA